MRGGDLGSSRRSLRMTDLNDCSGPPKLPGQQWTLATSFHESWWSFFCFVLVSHPELSPGTPNKGSDESSGPPHFPMWVTWERHVHSLSKQFCNFHVKVCLVRDVSEFRSNIRLQSEEAKCLHIWFQCSVVRGSWIVRIAWSYTVFSSQHQPESHQPFLHLLFTRL